MIQEASFTGLLRTVFIIIGVIAVLRFIGRFIANKRQQDQIRELAQHQNDLKQAKAESEKKEGEISIKSPSDKSKDENTMDVDFEETE